MEIFVQLISDDLGIKLEKVTPEMLGTCKKVGDFRINFVYLLLIRFGVLIYSCMFVLPVFLHFQLLSNLNFWWWYFKYVLLLQVTVSKDDTIILDGGGDKAMLEERIEQVAYLCHYCHTYQSIA